MPIKQLQSQTEYISYIYKQMEKQNTNFYSVVSLNDKNASKEIIKVLSDFNLLSNILNSSLSWAKIPFFSNWVNLFFNIISCNDEN